MVGQMYHLADYRWLGVNIVLGLMELGKLVNLVDDVEVFSLATVAPHLVPILHLLIPRLLGPLLTEERRNTLLPLLMIY